MYLFLSDETNTNQSNDVQFLIFGAVIVPMDKGSEAVEEIIKIRERAGYPAGSEFKFDSRSRPNNISQEQFNIAKSDILNLADKIGVRFMAYVVHHKIAENVDKKEHPLFALKTLLTQFDLFLSREKTNGICCVDRFDIAHPVLGTILTCGVDPASDLGKFKRQLSNIWMYSVTSINCSHLSTMCDVVLGSFRYCVNATQKKDVARTIYPNVKKLFLHSPHPTSVIEEWGLFLRPKNLRAKCYITCYQDLKTQLSDLEIPF